MRFCDPHARRVVGLGEHEGQSRASALPRATQALTLDSSPPPSSAQELEQRPHATAANAAAKALVYTALTKMGGPKAVPTVERQGMAVYYAASQLADTGVVMQGRKMAVVQLPEPVEGRAMPAHLATCVDQLPAQFQFEDVVLRRERITLQVYDLQAPRVIRPGPEGSMRAFTVTNGEVTTDKQHAPPFTRTMTYMCPADIPTPLLTPGPGGAILLVATCPITLVARAPGGLAGTSIHVMSKPVQGLIMVITELRVDMDNRQVVVTLTGGDPWLIEHRSLSKVKEDGNGKLSLTLKVAHLPALRRRKWTGWPVARTEWIAQTHLAGPTIILQAPPGKETDTTDAVSVYASLNQAASAGGAQPPPDGVNSDQVVQVQLHLRQPTDPRRTPVAAPGVPLVVQQAKSLPAPKPSRPGMSPSARTRSVRAAKPPAAKPSPKPSKPSPKSTTQLTLTQITRANQL